MFKRTANHGIDAIANAAGSTPDDAVALGSSISLYGPKRAPATAIGPSSPLAQTLASVTVTVGDELLPLLFVSAGQINAQLPSRLSEGQHTHVVRGTANLTPPASSRSSATLPDCFLNRSRDPRIGSPFTRTVQL